MIELIIRELENSDIPAIWKINEEGLPGTGKVSVNKVEMLIKEILGKIKLETKDVL